MRLRIASGFLACALLALAGPAVAAKCKVDGEWYDYGSGMCDGSSSSSSSGGSTADTSDSDQPTLKPGYVACLTEDHLDEMTTAINNGDDRLKNDLMGRVCVPTGSHIEFSLLDRGWTVAQIRVYTDQGNADMWTYIEALPDDL